ncbi:MAG: tRNA (adenosine(37)-N6)-threonylcarbamoyltransferase complex ATPase subunit type 1 TsaE [Elusimicrobia bacterium]|nr:tRNA (adenosine(37)-N6)-threonylcarbamoyltransferase complex ATPase subunit type 1 TsaE [Elusimicrobiota bacterium]
MKKFLSHSPNNTRSLAKKLARLIAGGEIIFLDGPIGSGKTIFVQGMARALGIKKSPVSASFSLMRSYKCARLNFFHLDMFRIAEKDIKNLGFEEFLSYDKAVIAVEWPAAAKNFFPKDRIEINFKLLNGDGREIIVKAKGKNSARIIRGLR